MATTTPTSYLELSKTYQEQVLGLIEQSQKLAVESVSAWTKAVQPLAKNAPAVPGRRRPVAEGDRRQPVRLRRRSCSRPSTSTSPPC